MNSTRNATEIRLSAPTRNRPNAAEAASPAEIVTTTAKMMRPQRNASHRISPTAAIDIAALSPAFLVNVAKPSSLIGTSPVS